MKTPQRIAFVHTVAFLAEEFRRRAAAELPSASVFHILNESLLQDLLRGEDALLVHRRVVAQVMLAVDAGAALVVMTCSSTSPGLDIARRLTGVPLLKIDDPMAARAVELGRYVGLVCTARSTVGPSTDLLQAHAAQQNRAIEVVSRVDDAAYAAILAGDRARHDKRVLDMAAQLAPAVDVLVLAQASLAHLQPVLTTTTGRPVLASPDLLMNELKNRLQG